MKKSIIVLFIALNVIVAALAITFVLYKVTFDHVLVLAISVFNITVGNYLLKLLRELMIRVEDIEGTSVLLNEVMGVKKEPINPNSHKLYGLGCVLLVEERDFPNKMMFVEFTDEFSQIAGELLQVTNYYTIENRFIGTVGFFPKLYKIISSHDNLNDALDCYNTQKRNF